MVSVENEFLFKKVYVEFCYVKYYGKFFFFNLVVIFFCWVEGFGGIGDGFFYVIWEMMRDYCFDIILICIVF